MLKQAIDKIEERLTHTEESCTIVECKPEIDVLRKYEKLFNIIKAKQPSPYFIHACRDYKDYYDEVVHCFESSKILTEEEFKLLKEWLK